MVISLAIISLSFANAAINFNISFPQSVELNKSFQVSISAETSLIYDVKIFVNNDSRTSPNSEILSDGEWKTPFYYLISVFPSASQFTIRALKLGSYPICARLRETTKSYPCSNCGEVCNNISVIEPALEPIQSQENNTPITNTSPNNLSTTNTIQNNPPLENNLNISQDNSKSTVSQGANSQASLQNEDADIIYLNKKPSQNIKEEIFISRDEKIRIWMAYGFAGLCILILIFVLIRKL